MHITGMPLSRRRFIGSIALAACLPRALAQTAGLRLHRLNTIGIRVSDIGRSVAFYQALFGTPVLSRAGHVSLGIGTGPRSLTLRAAGAGEVPGFTHLGYSVAGFEPARIAAGLAAAGFDEIDPPPLATPGIEVAGHWWQRERAGTPEVFFADPRGLVVQLSDPAYCGGSGRRGDVCRREPAAAPGLFALDDINHLTVFLNDGAGANTYYQDLFGLEVQAYQGPQGPVTGIGDGFQFVMYAGAASDTPSPANIHHACFTLAGFDVERIRAVLTDFGLEARDSGTGAGPLTHYVSLRMPARGGAEGGTPELYFTDPDGILMQLQDTSYCGGGGYFGEICNAG